MHSNLFGIAPLTQHGLSATYTNIDLQISAPTAHGPKIIIYGVKHLNANVWHFSLPKAQHNTANQVVRHEQHAELVLYASATFGSPPTKTFYKAVANGWLTNHTAPPPLWATSPSRGPAYDRPNPKSPPQKPSPLHDLKLPAHQPHLLRFKYTINVSEFPTYPSTAHQHQSHQTAPVNSNTA